MPVPIRVFHLIKGLGRGGAEKLLTEGLRFADRSAFEYGYGYFLPWKDALAGELRELGSDVVCFGSRNNVQIMAAARTIAEHLRRTRSDLVHCHLPVAGIAGRIAARMVGIPVVYSEHNLQQRYHPATRLLNRLTWGMQSRVVAVSGDVADSIRSNIGGRVPVEVVLNGVDVDRFRRDGGAGDEIRRSLGIPLDAPVVGTVAVFRAQKRLADWIAAARSVHDAVPEAHFVIVGDGPERETLLAAIEAADLNHSVHLPGLQVDVRPYLSAIDVYMMSSMFEGLPVALLEAMSMGCVPVCTSVGGIPEVVRTGETGALVPPERPDMLAKAALDFLGDSGRRSRNAAAAREAVEARFSMRKMTERLEDLYREVVNGRHAA